MRPTRFALPTALFCLPETRQIDALLVAKMQQIIFWSRQIHSEMVLKPVTLLAGAT